MRLHRSPWDIKAILCGVSNKHILFCECSATAFSRLNRTIANSVWMPAWFDSCSACLGLGHCLHFSTRRCRRKQADCWSRPVLCAVTCTMVTCTMYLHQNNDVMILPKVQSNGGFYAVARLLKRMTSPMIVIRRCELTSWPVVAAHVSMRYVCFTSNALP